MSTSVVSILVALVYREPLNWRPEGVDQSLALTILKETIDLGQMEFRGRLVEMGGRRYGYPQLERDSRNKFGAPDRI